MRAGYLIHRKVSGGLNEKDAEKTFDDGAGEFGVGVAADLFKSLDDGGQKRHAAELVGSNVLADM